MAITILSEPELISLIQNIITKGSSQGVRQWIRLDTHDQEYSRFMKLRYMEYNIDFLNFQEQEETSSVRQVFMQLRKKSSWFSQRESRRVFRLVAKTVADHRYVKVIQENPKILKCQIGEYNFANETIVSMSSNENYEFVTLEFIRVHD
jgi:hypothetical protein